MTSLEVITGSMFSGKTLELIRRIEKYKFAVPKREIFLFKNREQSRYHGDGLIRTHSGMKHFCNDIGSINSIFWQIERDLKNQFPVIGIDEFQLFFEENAIEIIKKILDRFHPTLIISGLARDSRGEPFKHMPHLLCMADDITVLSAICKKCGKEATQTQRLKDSDAQIFIDDGTNYEARCRECWEPR